MDLTFGLGAILGPLAQIIGDKILMANANELASIEKQLELEEGQPYVDRDDELIGRLRKTRKRVLAAYSRQVDLLAKAKQ